MRRLGKVSDVVEYSPNDIDSDFRRCYARILNVTRGAGLWLWKPYFVQKALKSIKDGEFLFYCDSGTVVIRDVRYLIRDLEASGQDMMFFSLPLLEKQFTKRECFKILGMDADEDGNANQTMGTYFLLRKTRDVEAFISDWLEKCCDERLISPEHFCSGVQESPDFVAHREDQSVLSLLLRKRKDFVRFKEPTQYGMFPWEYGRSGYLFRLPKTFPGTAPVCIISVRRTAFPRKIFVLVAKILLWKLGIYSADFFWKRMGYPTILN